jgi:hypothetical protein
VKLAVTSAFDCAVRRWVIVIELEHPVFGKLDLGAVDPGRADSIADGFRAAASRVRRMVADGVVPPEAEPGETVRTTALAMGGVICPRCEARHAADLTVCPECGLGEEVPNG